MISDAIFKKNQKKPLVQLFLLLFIAWLIPESLLMARSNSYLDHSFRLISERVGVEESLLRAICWQESRHRPHAYAEHDGGNGNGAFGICQVLYTTAKHFGLRDTKCEASFTQVSKEHRTYKNCKLFGPKTNMYYAAMFLKSRLKKYKGNRYKAIAAYNSGSYKRCRDGWLRIKGKRFKKCLIGGALNSYYVQHVHRALRASR